MTKLNQIIALANGEKGRAQKAITEVHHKLQRSELTSGLSRTYTPRDEEGETLPPESKNVHYTVTQGIDEVCKALTKVYKLVYLQDEANCRAVGSIDIGDVAMTIPVTHLLYLEKQLVDLITLISKLPILDPSENWLFDSARNVWVTPVKEQIRTKKVPRNHIKYEATHEHPAQVEMYMEDVNVGMWSVTKFSGALPAEEQASMLERAKDMLDAVKSAREAANCTEVQNDLPPEHPILKYIFG